MPHQKRVINRETGALNAVALGATNISATIGGKTGALDDTLLTTSAEDAPAAELGRLLETHRGERHCIVLQSFPDPDAISSALAHAAIAAKYDIECDIAYDGMVSHHENVALVQLLNIPLVRICGANGADVDLTRGDLRLHFRPEFLNRVDEIVVFHSLTEDDLKRILTIQLGRLRRRLEDRRITLELTDAALSRLARNGYDPTYGARPLKRAIQKELETPLGRRILAGEVRDGQAVMVDWDADRFTFTSAAEAEREQAETANV
jgi:hypothetical protein